MTVTAAIVQETRTNRIFRWIAPVAVLVFLMTMILSPGFVTWRFFDAFDVIDGSLASIEATALETAPKP